MRRRSCSCTEVPRTRTDFNEAAAVFFAGSLIGWRAAAGNERRDMAKQLLKNAQKSDMVPTLGSAAWSLLTITTAMNNALRRANKRAREAAAVPPQEPE